MSEEIKPYNPEHTQPAEKYPELENRAQRYVDGISISKDKAKEKSPTETMETLGKIRDIFRPIILGSPEDSQKVLTEKMKSELSSIEKRATREGVNFAKCQMDKIIKAYGNGKQVEFEALSPYLADYNMATGEIWADKLTESDAVGLAVSGLLREEFPDARLISLYDEYNSGMPESSNFSGAPTREVVEGSIIKDIKREKVDAPQLIFPKKTKNNFKNSLEKLLRIGGAIKENEEEGKDYLFVSESSKVASAETLVEKLESKGKIERDGQAIYFVNPEAENPAYRKINLRTASGRWLCEALDASSYIDEKNLAITHLVVLPNEFIEQQDKVWEILRTLGIEPTNYHNIFYDKDTPPEKVVEVIRDEIETYSRAQERAAA